MSLRSIRESLKWAVEANTASSEQFVVVLGTRAESRRSQEFGTFFAATDDPLLREAVTEQDRHVLMAFSAVQTYATGEFCVAL